MEISSKINEILEAKGMGADELSEKTGLPRMTIFNARRGKNITIVTAMKISEALEVPVEEIWAPETSELKENSNADVSAV